jgi:two-component system, NtrC family, response regulator AtoC
MVLEGAGHRVVEAAGEPQAYSLLNNGLDPDLLIYDPSTAIPSANNRLCQLLQSVPAERLCLILGMNHAELRNEASRLGVRLFLNKPVTREDLESVIDGLNRPADVCDSDGTIAPEIAGTMSQDARPLADDPPVPYLEELGGNQFFLAASPQMLEIHRQVKLLADIDVNVLILGESGTGKEVIAHLIHKNSRRSKEKFLKVNCAALPAELLESELFGHRQGAFTGAINDRQGKFEQANRGTLLLDEIGEIGVQMQAKLLHVLQDGQFARLGAQETTKVDVRVLAATNVQIENALMERTFREDLYYRLSVFTIKVPPLRERREEIPYLIEQMISRAPAEMTNGCKLNFSSRLVDLALSYDWRGNVRELRNFVTRTIIMRDSQAAARELEEKIATLGDAAAYHQPVDTTLPCAGIRSVVRDVKDRTETEMIQNALDAFGWNRRRAAQYLNISYRGLLYKIQQHCLSPTFVPDPLQAFQNGGHVRKKAAIGVGSESSHR